MATRLSDFDYAGPVTTPGAGKQACPHKITTDGRLKFVRPSLFCVEDPRMRQNQTRRLPPPVFWSVPK